jgi:hypothetical protein
MASKRVSFPAGRFCFQPGAGVDDIAANLTSSGHESEDPFPLGLWRRGDDFGNRFAESGDYHWLSGLTDMFQHREAGRLELRNRTLPLS